MGMGIMELAVVFLIAFLVLGPSRSIDTARSAGKLIGELRRSFNDVMEAMNLERDQEKGPTGQVPVDRAQSQTDPNSNPDNGPPTDQPPADQPPPDRPPPFNKE